MNKQTLRSAVLAMALTLGASATLTIGHSLAAPTVAQAGVLGGLKNAAKSIGGAAKKVGGGVVHAAKAVKGGVSGAGGLVIGIVESFSGFYLPEGFKDVAAYIVVLVMLMIWPYGLFGERLRKRV